MVFLLTIVTHGPCVTSFNAPSALSAHGAAAESDQHVSWALQLDCNLYDRRPIICRAVQPACETSAQLPHHLHGAASADESNRCVRGRAAHGIRDAVEAAARTRGASRLRQRMRIIMRAVLLVASGLLR